jgi:lantibiotic modifying enzyme
MTFLDLADRIGARLCRDALWCGARCNWIGEAMRADGGMEWSTLGADLYTGAAGVALLLHHLADATGEPIFRQTADAALAQAASQADRIEPGSRAGFYSGWGGIAYLLAQFGRMDDALKLAKTIRVTDVAEPEADLLFGSAGAVIALLHVGLIEQAIQHGDALLARAEHSDAGCSWRTLADSSRGPHLNLTGLSHGAAGIGWALLELFNATAEPRFREAAEAAFRYERRWYDPARRNWADLRFRPADYPVSWCHGAAGIGFSRVRAALLLKSPCYREEADIALDSAQRSLAETAEWNFCLCHGLSGNADLLLYASQALGVPLAEPAAAALRTGIDIYEAQRKPWPCGLNGGGELPGLMLGAAGIAYQCLRLTDSSKYPSILLPVPG